MRKSQMKYQIIVWSIVWVLIGPAVFTMIAGQPVAHAENSIDKYWGTGDSHPSTGRENLILGTDNLYIKVAVFLSGVVFFYWMFFGIFQLLLQGDGAPDKKFFKCFFFFMLTIYGLVCVCFHEYIFLDQAYDPDLSLISQLKWMWAVGGFLIWGTLSLVTSNFLRQ